jgi:hypothetical protein
MFLFYTALALGVVIGRMWERDRKISKQLSEDIDRVSLYYLDKKHRSEN